MIEQLKESRGAAFGFKVTGKLTTVDIAAASQWIEDAIAANKRPIGLLADLSEMHGATWAARWDEMRFLQHHSAHIARMALVCNDQWQEISEMVLVAAGFLQAETLYCYPDEIHHAWHWVRMNPMDEAMPVRVIYPGKGLFQDYTPVPLPALVVEELKKWRLVSLYSADDDFLFPSVVKNGTQPISPDMILKGHIRPALKRIGVTKRIGWHSFRHGLGTMLRQQGMDLKIAQELLRHANSRITLEIYQQAVSDEKRVAQNHAFRGLLGGGSAEHPSAPSEAA